MGPSWFEDRPDADSRLSGHAVAIPGTVAGLLYALETYGTLGRQQVMQPAIDAAPTASRPTHTSRVRSTTCSKNPATSSVRTARSRSARSSAASTRSAAPTPPTCSGASDRNRIAIATDPSKLVTR
ncbi:MAG: gamma-glutamyltransferase [Phycisphaerales bacterium]